MLYNVTENKLVRSMQFIFLQLYSAKRHNEKLPLVDVGLVERDIHVGLDILRGQGLCRALTGLGLGHQRPELEHEVQAAAGLQVPVR